MQIILILSIQLRSHKDEYKIILRSWCVLAVIFLASDILQQMGTDKRINKIFALIHPRTEYTQYNFYTSLNSIVSTLSVDLHLIFRRMVRYSNRYGEQHKQNAFHPKNLDRILFVAREFSFDYRSKINICFLFQL